MQSNKRKKDKEEDISIEILSDYDEAELARAAEQEEQKKEQAAAQEAYDAAFAALEAQVESLKKENADLKDQMLRKAAEFDNFRKRSERERGEAYKRSRKDVLLDLLPVLDN